MTNFPDNWVEPTTREILELCAQLDVLGKQRLLYCVREFVAGYKPHNKQAVVYPFKPRRNNKVSK